LLTVAMPAKRCGRSPRRSDGLPRRSAASCAATAPTGRYHPFEAHRAAALRRRRLRTVNLRLTRSCSPRSKTFRRSAGARPRSIGHCAPNSLTNPPGTWPPCHLPGALPAQQSAAASPGTVAVAHRPQSPSRSHALHPAPAALREPFVSPLALLPLIDRPTGILIWMESIQTMPVSGDLLTRGWCPRAG
jgi:hypothetical protein